MELEIIPSGGNTGSRPLVCTYAETDECRSNGYHKLLAMLFERQNLQSKRALCVFLTMQPPCQLQ